MSTRRRVLAHAMRLFGEQGYAATTIAQIESAAGLRPGSGGLYRHFASKQELLETGIREQISAQPALLSFITDPVALASKPLSDRLRIVAKAALARLDAERDLNRIVLRDLADFPDLLRLVRADEMKAIGSMFTKWLATTGPDPAPSTVDWEALAAVVMGSLSHYWVLADSMGTHPSDVDEDRYIAALVDLVAHRLTSAG